jgi:hypothetical protein
VEGLVTIESGRVVERPRQMRDATVPQREQVLHRQPHAHSVVRGGGAHRQLLLTPVHEHEIYARFEQGVVQPVIAARCGGDDPVDLPGAHGLRVEQLPLGIVVGVGNQRRVSRRLESVLDAAQDGREKRVRQVGDQHTDGVRPVRLEPTGDRIRLVAEFLGRLEHAPRGFLVHQRARLLVEGSGYRGRVDASDPRDISQRHRCARSGVRNRHHRALCIRLQRHLSP